MENKEKNNGSRKRSTKKKTEKKKIENTNNNTIFEQQEKKLTNELLELKIENIINELFNNVIETNKLDNQSIDIDNLIKDKEVVMTFLYSLLNKYKQKNKMENIKDVINPIFIEDNIKNLILGFLINDTDLLSEIAKIQYTIITSFLDYMSSSIDEDIDVLSDNIIRNMYNTNNNDYVYLDSLISIFILIYYLIIIFVSFDDKNIVINQNNEEEEINNKKIFFNLCFLSSKYKNIKYPLSLINNLCNSEGSILKTSLMIFIHNFIINNIIYYIVHSLIIKQIKNEEVNLNIVSKLNLFYSTIPKEIYEKTISDITAILNRNLRDISVFINKISIKDSIELNNSELIVELSLYKLIVVFLSLFFQKYLK